MDAVQKTQYWYCHLSLDNNLIEDFLGEVCDLVQLLVVEAEVSHQGDLVPELFVALRALKGMGAGEQGGEDTGVMCQDVILEVLRGFLAVSAGGTLILHVGVLRGH